MNELERIKEYNERKIATTKTKAIKYYILFKVAVESIQYKNNRQKKNLENLAIKLSRASSYEEKLSVYRKINKALNSIEMEKASSLSAITDIIEKRFSINRIESDYMARSDYAMKIYSDPVGMARQYASSNISCYQEIEEYQKEIETARKEAQKITKQAEPEKSPYEYTETPTYRGRPTSTPSYTSTYSTRERTQIPSSEPKISSYDQNQAIDDIMSLIEKSANDHTIPDGLTYTQQEALREAFNNSNSYYSSRAISQAVSMNQISQRITDKKIIFKDSQFKTSKSIEDLINLAVTCYNVQVFDLLNSNGFGNDNDIDTKINSRKLMSKLNTKNALVVYTKAYNNFLKYYKSLSPDYKDKVDNIIKNSVSERYKEIFNLRDNYERIITPDELKAAINRKVKEEIMNWQMINDYNYSHYYSNLKSATRLMSVEDVVELYKNIKYQFNRYNAIRDTENNERIIEQRNKSLTQLQRCFTEIIRDKIGYQTSFVGENLTDTEKKEILKKIELENASVCIDYLEEKPLFLLNDTILKDIKQGGAKKKGELHEALQEAQQRFYGMNKLQQTIARATGAYAKLRRLQAKTTEITEEDISQARRLF